MWNEIKVFARGLVGPLLISGHYKKIFYCQIMTTLLAEYCLFQVISAHVLTNLTDVRLPNSRHQRCKMKRNCMVMVIDADV